LATQSAAKKFSKRNRLLRHADFERVYKQGRRHFGSHITVFYLLRDREPQFTGPRIGFTVGKALGGAVQRNRMKRRLREAVRMNVCLLEASADVVINPKRLVLTAEFDDLQSEIVKAFRVIQTYSEKGKQR
jgi:ribonuclease P protein component